MKRFLESLQMLALVLVFCLFTLHYGKALPKLFRHPHFKHVIIIDAGSTGTRCHVFRVAATSSVTTTTYGKDASVTPKLILPTKSYKTTPGLGESFGSERHRRRVAAFVELRQRVCPDGELERDADTFDGNCGFEAY